jgi:hypothetical protein
MNPKNDNEDIQSSIDRQLRMKVWACAAISLVLGGVAIVAGGLDSWQGLWIGAGVDAVLLGLMIFVGMQDD